MENKRSSVGLITTLKESREKSNSLLTMVFTLVIIVLLIIFAIRPTITTIVKIDKEIKEKDRITKLLDERIQTLSALVNEYDDSREKFDFLTMVYPETEMYPLMLSNIEPIVKRNSLELSTFNYQKYENKSYNISTSVLQPSIIHISVKGEYDNFINLLKDLESLPMFPVVEGVNFANNETSQGISQSFNVILRIYEVKDVNFYSID